MCTSSYLCVHVSTLYHRYEIPVKRLLLSQPIPEPLEPRNRLSAFQQASVHEFLQALLIARVEFDSPACRWMSAQRDGKLCPGLPFAVCEGGKHGAVDLGEGDLRVVSGHFAPSIAFAILEYRLKTLSRAASSFRLAVGMM